MRSFFRNVPTTETPAKPDDDRKAAGRRVEIVVDREIVSVFHPPRMAASGEHHCPFCGQTMPAAQLDCPAHPARELSLGLIDNHSNTKLLPNPIDEVK